MQKTKLTEANQLFLKGALINLGIKGEVDEFGNVFNVETESEEDKETRIFGITFKRKGKITKKKVPYMTLQDIMGLLLDIEYDPNTIVKEIVKGTLKK